MNQLVFDIFARDPFSQDTLHKNHAKHRTLFIRAYDRGEMGGFVFGWPQGSLVVHGLAVKASLRRNGVGTALLKTFEAAALRAGVQEIRPRSPVGGNLLLSLIQAE